MQSHRRDSPFVINGQQFFKLDVRFSLRIFG
jgi:hypothetical protein